MTTGNKVKQHERTTEMSFTTVNENLCGQSSTRAEAGQYCKGQQKGLFKYVNSKKRTRVIIGLLLGEVSHFTNRDVDKAVTKYRSFQGLD